MRLVLLGHGGYGHVIEDMAIQSKKYEEILFLDDNSKKKCSSFIEYINSDTEFYPAFGKDVYKRQSSIRSWKNVYYMLNVLLSIVIIGIRRNK